jgi:hypothetical protein
MCYVLAGLPSRSPVMMNELGRLSYLLDNNNIHMRTRYMKSAATMWPDKLSRHPDNDD